MALALLLLELTGHQANKNTGVIYQHLCTCPWKYSQSLWDSIICNVAFMFAWWILYSIYPVRWCQTDVKPEWKKKNKAKTLQVKGGHSSSRSLSSHTLVLAHDVPCVWYFRCLSPLTLQFLFLWWLYFTADWLMGWLPSFCAQPY